MQIQQVKRHTSKHVAEMANVSLMTVSRVFTGKSGVSQITREKVLNAASQLGYVPDGQARAMRTGQTGRIGLVIPSLLNLVYAQRAHEIQQAAWSQGYDIAMVCSEWSETHEEELMRHLLSIRVDGLIVLGVATLFSQQLLNQFVQRRIPVVRVVGAGSRGLRGAKGISTLTIAVDDGARMAVEHLLSLGHKRIGLWGIDRPNRLSGARMALKKAKVNGCELDMMSRNVGSTDVSSYRAMTQYLKETNNLPTALFALNDQIAIGAMAALVDAGIRIPKDVAIVGFDDISLASIVRPSLTTVSQMHLQIGQMAVQTVVEHISNSKASPSHVHLTPNLIIRQSCGAQRGNTEDNSCRDSKSNGALGDHDHIRHEVKRKQAVSSH